MFTSKYRTEPFKGKVSLSRLSSLRKLTRAMSRGVVDDARQVIVDTAVKAAERRSLLYLHAAARRRAKES